MLRIKPTKLRTPILTIVPWSYAAAIIGISGLAPDLSPGPIDLSEARSAFAHLAYEEAERDSALATWTALQLHYWANYLRAIRAGQADYDRVAEGLLLKAAGLDYPNPTKIDALRSFYRDESAKPSDRVVPAAKIVAVPPEEAARRIIAPPTKFSGALEAGHSATPVPVEILIGIDGHVWTATVKDAPSTWISTAAQRFAENLTFQPLRVAGEAMCIKTSAKILVNDRGQLIEVALNN